MGSVAAACDSVRYPVWRSGVRVVDAPPVPTAGARATVPARVVAGSVRGEVDVRGRVEWANIAMSEVIIASARTVDGYSFVARDGSIAESSTFLGRLYFSGRISPTPAPDAPFAHSCGRLAVADRFGVIHVRATGTSNEFAQTTLDLPAVSAAFENEQSGVAVVLGGGLWRTSDGGSNWSRVETHVPALSVTCVDDGLMISTNSGAFMVRGDQLQRVAQINSPRVIVPDYRTNEPVGIGIEGAEALALTPDGEPPTSRQIRCAPAATASIAANTREITVPEGYGHARTFDGALVRVVIAFSAHHRNRAWVRWRGIDAEGEYDASATMDPWEPSELAADMPSRFARSTVLPRYEVVAVARTGLLFSRVDRTPPRANVSSDGGNPVIEPARPRKEFFMVRRGATVAAVGIPDERDDAPRVVDAGVVNGPGSTSIAAASTPGSTAEAQSSSGESVSAAGATLALNGDTFYAAMFGDNGKLFVVHREPTDGEKLDVWRLEEFAPSGNRLASREITIPQRATFHALLERGGTFSFAVAWRCIKDADAAVFAFGPRGEQGRSMAFASEPASSCRHRSNATRALVLTRVNPFVEAGSPQASNPAAHRIQLHMELTEGGSCVRAVEMTRVTAPDARGEAGADVLGVIVANDGTVSSDTVLGESRERMTCTM